MDEDTKFVLWMLAFFVVGLFSVTFLVLLYFWFVSTMLGWLGLPNDGLSVLVVGFLTLIIFVVIFAAILAASE